MKSVNPYLNFKGNAEEAFNFYQSVFGGELDIIRFKDMDDNMGVTGDDLNKIANATLPIGAETLLLGSDAVGSWGESFQRGNDFYINLEPENPEEAKQLFEKLSEGGQIEMPLQKTEWAEYFGMCSDPFGIRWMVNYEGK
ncbi:MAG: VOC family protein [Balneola sp.]